MAAGRVKFPQTSCAPCAPEPTPNPSREGNYRRADDRLLPSWERSGVGRFRGRLVGEKTNFVAADKAVRVPWISLLTHSDFEGGNTRRCGYGSVVRGATDAKRRHSALPDVGPAIYRAGSSPGLKLGFVVGNFAPTSFCQS